MPWGRGGGKILGTRLPGTPSGGWHETSPECPRIFWRFSQAGVSPDFGALDRALNGWNQAWGGQDDALAMDGKTMKNAVDETGRQTHIMSVVGHESKRSYAQKK